MPKKKITIQGDTIDFAIRKGLERIGLSQEDIYIKVEQRNSHGLFGGHYPAIVSLFYEEKESKDALAKRTAEEFERNFKFDFKELGARICLPAMFYDRRYYENDEKREEFLLDFLSQKFIESPDPDPIKQLSTNPQAQDTFVTVKTFSAESLNDRGDMIHLIVSNDRMSAKAIIFHFYNELDDVTREIEGANIEIVTEDEIYNYLREKKITHGILRRNIQEIIALKYTGFFGIAKGKNPIDDAPAPLEIFFQESEHKAFGDMMEALTIDTRSVKDINIADRNQLLMRVGELTLGEDGYNIEGSKLRKKEISQAASLKCGSNVYRSDNEKEIFAKKAGHITWNPRDHFINIEPVYIVDGNVDFNEGNIIGFVGKVVIRGDVKPKFSVVAEGDIEIHGSVEDAIVESTTGNVFIGGSIIHQNEGYIQAKNNVHGMIATNAKIRASNIVLQKEVMNSDLEATNEIIILGNPGVLVGGIAKARNLIRVNIIGSESWVPTKVHVGDVSEKKKRLRALNQQVGKKLSELKETKQIIKMMQERQQSHELTEAQQDQLQFSLDRVGELEEDIEYDREEEEDIKKEIESQREAQLEVLKTIHPHVDLYLFEGYYLPPTAENRTGFHCKEGLIVRYSLL